MMEIISNNYLSKKQGNPQLAVGSYIHIADDNVFSVIFRAVRNPFLTAFLYYSTPNPLSPNLHILIPHAIGIKNHQRGYYERTKVRKLMAAVG